MRFANPSLTIGTAQMTNFWEKKDKARDRYSIQLISERNEVHYLIVVGAGSTTALQELYLLASSMAAPMYPEIAMSLLST